MRSIFLYLFILFSIIGLVGLLNLFLPEDLPVRLRFTFIFLLLSLGSVFLIYFVWTRGIYVIKGPWSALLVTSFVLFIVAFLLGKQIIKIKGPPFDIIFAAGLIIVASLVAIIAKRGI